MELDNVFGLLRHPIYIELLYSLIALTCLDVVIIIRHFRNDYTLSYSQTREFRLIVVLHVVCLLSRL